MAPELKHLAWSLGLGLLVGLQREREAAPLAGFRTFPLVAAFGTVCAWLARGWGGWIVAAGLLALAVILVMANVLRARAGDRDAGLTTEVATLLLFGVGAYIPDGNATVAMVLAATTAVLLHLKPQLHNFAHRLGDHDFRAIMQFVVIALVILPVLPNEPFGPFHALNPHRVWWMVVLITGISLGGYLVHKAAGDRVGVLAGGLLGGLVSSTATSVTHSRHARSQPSLAPAAATVILLASSIVFSRLAVLAWAADPAHALDYLPPFAVLLALLAAFAAWAWRRHEAAPASLPLPSNPTELRSALAFTLLYAAILVGVAYARERHGNAGLLWLAAVSGLTDMDAITLSAAQLSSNGHARPAEALRAILVAAASNLAFKTLLVGLYGGRALLARVAPPFAAAALVALGWAAWLQ